MKLTRKVLSAALLAGLGVALVAPNAVKAVDDVKDSNADIEFTKNTSEPPLTPPTTSDSEPITGLTTHSVDEFGIRAVTPLDFDKHAATVGVSGEYWALPFKDGGREIENFVAIKDIRSTLDQKWKLSGRLKEQFKGSVSGTDKYLDGASITYTNMNLAADGVDPALQPTAMIFGNGSGTQVLSEGAATVPFAQNTEEDKGKGYYFLTFGDDAQGTAGSSIKMNIPSSTNIFNTKYTATIEWTLSETL
ncbi:WxL domain-containing protein [Enterococcus sp. LJL51]|uniref:WxL domain-containing protein n=1 Tax=Enterococcus sp. LJL51 TaxID=3416656 RepID=UPI003CEFC553